MTQSSLNIDSNFLGSAAKCVGPTGFAFGTRNGGRMTRKGKPNEIDLKSGGRLFFPIVVWDRVDAQLCNGPGPGWL